MALPEPGFLDGLPPGFAEALKDLEDSPSPFTGVGGRSPLSREDVLVKLFSLTRGEGTSGVADLDPAGVSFWTLAPGAGFFLLLSDALDPRRTWPPTGPSSNSRVGVVLRDEVRECDPERTLPLRVRFGSFS